MIEGQSKILPRRRGVLSRVLWSFIGYFLVSCVTVPFVGLLWLGELPLLALVQLPKLSIASWICKHVLMQAMSLSGLSLGSFSPDYLFARPYSLALVYLIPMTAIGLIGFRPANKGHRRLTLAFLGIGAIDFVLTLLFVNRSLSLY